MNGYLLMNRLITPSNAGTLLKTCVNISNSWQRTPLPMIGAERSLPSPTRRRSCLDQDKVGCQRYHFSSDRGHVRLGDIIGKAGILELHACVDGGCEFLKRPRRVWNRGGDERGWLVGLAAP